MATKVLQILKSFGWKQWLVVAAFLLVVGFTSFYAYRSIRGAMYWRTHQDDPIEGWMTVGHIAHSYHVPPHVLYSALGLPNKPPDKRPLRKIARDQNRSLDDVKAILNEAIVHARPPFPPPTPPEKQEEPR